MGRRRETQITRNIIASINALFRLLKEFTGAPGMRGSRLLKPIKINNIVAAKMSMHPSFCRKTAPQRKSATIAKKS